MVRTSRPLVERMTLVWHDWFATSTDGVGSQKLMLDQNKLLRRLSLGSFETMLREITKDPAMLLWLSGTQNSKRSPNENYARELMELFTLGAGRGYTERDVREQARALTGFANDWRKGAGTVNFRFEARPARRGTQARVRQDGALRLAGRGPALPPAPEPPVLLRRQALELLRPGRARRRHPPLARSPSTSSDFQILPVVEAILRHPALYTGPRMVKPPVVYTAGLLRALGRGVDTQAWSWLSDQSGQRLFRPPNVSGWDDERWLDTATFRGRWEVANYASQPYCPHRQAVGRAAVRAEGARGRRDRLLGLPHAPARDARGAAPVRDEGDGAMRTPSGSRRATGS